MSITRLLNSLAPDATDRIAASEEEIQSLAASLCRPISDIEYQELEQQWINQRDILIDAAPRSWVFPYRPLPDTYLDLLRWDNSGDQVIVNGEYPILIAKSSDVAVLADTLSACIQSSTDPQDYLWS